MPRQGTKKRVVPKRLQGALSRKISKLRHEGMEQDQAIAAGINMVLTEDKKRKAHGTKASGRARTRSKGKGSVPAKRKRS